MVNVTAPDVVAGYYNISVITKDFAPFSYGFGAPIESTYVYHAHNGEAVHALHFIDSFSDRSFV